MEGADALPEVMVDVAARNPYGQRGQPGTGLDRIWVVAPDGALRDLADESAVVGALKPFRRFCIYVRDDNARERVMSIIEETKT